ncbi:MAG: DUF3343 domain-containing protein [bacterium]|nr:DUF3343 domain-containing protein [bacterium]
MRKYLIATGTVTYAMKAKNILGKKGYRVRVEKTRSNYKSNGCGYGVVIWCNDIIPIEELLVSSGVKILGIEEIANGLS